MANEPAIYREVICAALKELRPDIEIFTSEPDDLEGEFLRILPQLVVCSRPTKLVERKARPRASSSTPVALRTRS